MARYTPTLIHHLPRELPAIDLHLPDWARRSNPVVRRHLGVYAKTVPPQIQTFITLYLWQVGVILLTIPLPFIFNVTLPLITVSLLLLPVTMVTYVQMLVAISNDAAMTMVSELKSNTFHLLRTTPLSLTHILLGKVAASLWRRMDDLTLVLFSVTLFSAPPIVLQYANLWPPETQPYLAHTAMILVLGACILRVALEPFMIAALGVMVGAAMPVRNVAVPTTLGLAGFYYLLINLPRLLPLSWPLRMLVEAGLPVLLPVVIAISALCLASSLLTRD